MCFGLCVTSETNVSHLQTKRHTETHDPPGLDRRLWFPKAPVLLTNTKTDFSAATSNVCERRKARGIQWHLIRLPYETKMRSIYRNRRALTLLLTWVVMVRVVVQVLPSHFLSSVLLSLCSSSYAFSPTFLRSVDRRAAHPPQRRQRDNAALPSGRLPPADRPSGAVLQCQGPAHGRRRRQEPERRPGLHRSRLLCCHGNSSPCHRL